MKTKAEILKARELKKKSKQEIPITINFNSGIPKRKNTFYLTLDEYPGGILPKWEILFWEGNTWYYKGTNEKFKGRVSYFAELHISEIYNKIKLRGKL